MISFVCDCKLNYDYHLNRMAISLVLVRFVHQSMDMIGMSQRLNADIQRLLFQWRVSFMVEFDDAMTEFALLSIVKKNDL